MDAIGLRTQKKFTEDIEILKDNFEEFINVHQNTTNYANTEGAIVWIIRGCIDYFFELETHFLGTNNNSGVPDIEADRFANNFYRLVNAIDYLKELWKFDIDKNEDINFLLDIRTLIVHSGEKLDRVKSLKLKDYKDSQLGRIFVRENCRAFRFPDEYSDMDYLIQIWSDKHDKSKKHNLEKVDHHITNKSYHDTDIFLKSEDVKNIILCYISELCHCRGNVEITPNRYFPKEVRKEQFIDKHTGQIEFDKIVNLISKDTNGGYFEENKVGYWKGFGLKKMYEYTKKYLMESNPIQKIILDKIYDTMSQYWDDYENNSLQYYEIINLDIRSVFSCYTPRYELKEYLEGEKLFNYIAPYFNTKEQTSTTDQDYLEKFISAASEALGNEISIKQETDDLVCDYFVKSIDLKLKIDRDV